jgi:hypothetical protein
MDWMSVPPYLHSYIPLRENEAQGMVATHGMDVSSSLPAFIHSFAREMRQGLQGTAAAIVMENVGPSHPNPLS